MQLLSSVLNLFHDKGVSVEEQQQKNAINSLVSYCVSLINREDLVAETIESFRKLNSRTDQFDVMQYMSVYIVLEQFIVGNKKPIIKSEFTRQQLREEIRTHIKLDELPGLFRVLFVPNKYQRISLYEIGLKMIMKEVEKSFGSGFLHELYAKEVRGTVLQTTVLNDGAISFSGLYKDAQTLQDEQIVYAFSKLYRSFYDKLIASIGREAGVKPFVDFYSIVKKNYEYDNVLEVIEVLPSEITQDDRLEFLSKEELKKQIKEATQQLQRERDQAKVIVESIDEGLFMIDLELRITEINSSACKALQVSKEQIMGKNIHDAFPLLSNNATVLRLNNPVAQVLRTGKSYITSTTERYSTQSTTGKVFPIIFSVTAIHGKEHIMGCVLAFRDITEIARYERALEEAKKSVEQKVVDRTHQLRETQNRLFTFLDKMPLGVVIFDQEKRLHFANTAISTIIKKTVRTDVLKVGELASDIFSKITLYDIKRQRSIDPSQHLLEAVFAGKPFHSRDLEIVAGTAKAPIEIFATPVFNERGKVEFAIVVTKDISEEKIIERSKDEFFSIASHELRTPLTAIRGNVSLIQDYFSDKVTDPQLKEMIEDIHQSSVQLIGIVNDFLNVSRLEQGRMKFEQQQFDIQEVVKEVLLEYEEEAKKKGLILTCDARYLKPGESTLVVADKTKTKEVLVNLTGNALKYTEHGGVMLSCEHIDNHLRVRIADTGRGISEDGKRLLFRKFQQTGDNLYTRDTTKSTGLGLYISKMIIEGMHGKIFLEYSELGKGSVFTFDLPLVK